MRSRTALTIALVMRLLACRCDAQMGDVVPEPIDVPPHHRGFLAGERHFDISNAPEMVHHQGDHFVSFGHHNYDITDDPAYRDHYAFEESRWRGSGRGLDRAPLLQWSPAEFDLPPERPWVVSRIRTHGLRYTPPAGVAIQPPRFDRPPPSYYAVYRKRPSEWEKAVRRWDNRWLPGAARGSTHHRRHKHSKVKAKAPPAAGNGVTPVH